MPHWNTSKNSLLRLAAGASALVLVAWPTAPRAAELDADEIATCVRENRPAGNTLETVELRSTDRLGNELVRRATIYSGRSLDAERAVFVQLIYPSDLTGSRLLIAERAGAVQMFVSLAGEVSLKHIEAAGRSPGLFGTDFSSEDLARLYGMSRPGRSERLPDAESEGRPTWVIRTVPPPEAISSYSAVVTHVDQDTCAVLRSEHYEREGQLRKVLSVPLAGVRRVGSAWLAQDLRMRDLRDGTSTRLVVERVETGDRVRDLPIRLPPVAAAPPATGR